MTLTPQPGCTAEDTLQTSLLIDSTALDDLAGGTYIGVQVILTGANGNTATLNSLAAGSLDANNDYDFPASLFGTGVTSIPYDFYKVDITDLADATNIYDSGCVLIDCALNCQVHDKVRANLKRPNDKRTELHIVQEAILATNNCSSCSCDDAIELYKQLKEDVTQTTLTNDCGCS